MLTGTTVNFAKIELAFVSAFYKFLASKLMAVTEANNEMNVGSFKGLI